VHHVAWGTTVAEHPQWLERLAEAGVPSTPVIDRYYFHSIYFREPSGVLFEIADDGPGFTVDGAVEELGTKIILPPFLESRRAEIEARLTPLPDPRARSAS
jgi:glyoxalase family protein